MKWLNDMAAIGTLRAGRSGGVLGFDIEDIKGGRVTSRELERLTTDYVTRNHRPSRHGVSGPADRHADTLSRAVTGGLPVGGSVSIFGGVSSARRDADLWRDKGTTLTGRGIQSFADPHAGVGRRQTASAGMKWLNDMAAIGTLRAGRSGGVLGFDIEDIKGGRVTSRELERLTTDYVTRSHRPSRHGVSGPADRHADTLSRAVTGGLPVGGSVSIFGGVSSARRDADLWRWPTDMRTIGAIKGFSGPEDLRLSKALASATIGGDFDFSAGRPEAGATGLVSTQGDLVDIGLLGWLLRGPAAERLNLASFLLTLLSPATSALDSTGLIDVPSYVTPTTTSVVALAAIVLILTQASRR